MILCPTCPLCGHPPAPSLMMLWPSQAFCDNGDCDAFCWNPTRSLDANLLDSKVHRMPDWLGGEPG